MSALHPQTPSELFAILEQQPPGTLLLIYWEPEGYPIVTQTITRQRQHWTTLMCGEYEAGIIKNEDIIYSLQHMDGKMKVALMCWDNVSEIVLDAVKD